MANCLNQGHKHSDLAMKRHFWVRNHHPYAHKTEHRESQQNYVLLAIRHALWQTA